MIMEDDGTSYCMRHKEFRPCYTCHKEHLAMLQAIEEKPDEALTATQVLQKRQAEDDKLILNEDFDERKRHAMNEFVRNNELKVVPIRGRHQSFNSLAGEAMERKEAVRGLIFFFEEDGTMSHSQFNLQLADLGMILMHVQKMAVDAYAELDS